MLLHRVCVPANTSSAVMIRGLGVMLVLVLLVLMLVLVLWMLLVLMLWVLWVLLLRMWMRTVMMRRGRSRG